MIVSIPQSRFFKITYTSYVVVFFLYLLMPLSIVGVFAFHDSNFPSPPWQGATLDWFIANTDKRIGLLFEEDIHSGIINSAWVAVAVTVLSLIVGTCNAFLFERKQFPLKSFLYLLSLLPLVIPGVILGVAILVFSNTLSLWFENFWNLELELLQPGLLLVILGQFSFITTITTLVIAARLRKFDHCLEEAALDLGASQWQAIRTVTLPFLRPAIIGAGIVCFLMSFENFNTTLMLVGSDAPLTITLFDKLRQGSTPVLNAVSLALMFVTALMAIASVLLQKK